MTSTNIATWVLASLTLLWVIVIGQGIVLIGLLRQVGILSLRIRPYGARVTDDGIAIGTKFPDVPLTQDSGAKRTVKIPLEFEGRFVVVVFVAPGCPACARVVPGVRALLTESPEVSWVLISFGDEESSEAFRQAHVWPEIGFYRAEDAVRTELRMHTVPYALLLDPEGKVLTKGVVNNIEHIESLLEVIRSSTSVLQVSTEGDQ